MMKPCPGVVYKLRYGLLRGFPFSRIIIMEYLSLGGKGLINILILIDFNSA